MANIREAMILELEGILTFAERHGLDQALLEDPEVADALEHSTRRDYSNGDISKAIRIAWGIIREASEA